MPVFFNGVWCVVLPILMDRKLIKQLNMGILVSSVPGHTAISSQKIGDWQMLFIHFPAPAQASPVSLLIELATFQSLARAKIRLLTVSRPRTQHSSCSASLLLTVPKYD